MLRACVLAASLVSVGRARCAPTPPREPSPLQPVTSELHLCGPQPPHLSAPITESPCPARSPLVSGGRDGLTISPIGNIKLNDEHGRVGIGARARYLSPLACAAVS
jgi:hypothetical protein